MKNVITSIVLVAIIIVCIYFAVLYNENQGLMSALSVGAGVALVRLIIKLIQRLGKNKKQQNR